MKREAVGLTRRIFFVGHRWVFKSMTRHVCICECGFHFRPCVQDSSFHRIKNFDIDNARIRSCGARRNGDASRPEDAHDAEGIAILLHTCIHQVTCEFGNCKFGARVRVPSIDNFYHWFIASSRYKFEQSMDAATTIIQARTRGIRTRRCIHWFSKLPYDLRGLIIDYVRDDWQWDMKIRRAVRSTIFRLRYGPPRGRATYRAVKFCVKCVPLVSYEDHRRLVGTLIHLMHSAHTSIERLFLNSLFERLIASPAFETSPRSDLPRDRS